MRASVAPAKAVMITTNTVLSAPIEWPIFISRYISAAGISVNARKSLSSIIYEIL
jgi:hypothetical protein